MILFFYFYRGTIVLDRYIIIINKHLNIVQFFLAKNIMIFLACSIRQRVMLIALGAQMHQS